MLPKSFRASRNNIEETAKGGKIISGDLIYAKISRKDKEKPSFAVVISKKNEKTSVGRHLLKRRINSVLERIISEGKMKINKTTIFFVKKSENQKDYKEIEKEIRGILARI